MSDQTADLRPARRRVPGPEYWAYFAPIFVLGLPLAATRAAWAVISSEPAPRPGVVQDAWSRAADVTAMIFSA
jgi:hypothetical protein